MSSNYKSKLNIIENPIDKWEIRYLNKLIFRVLKLIIIVRLILNQNRLYIYIFNKFRKYFFK